MLAAKQHERHRWHQRKRLAAAGAKQVVRATQRIADGGKQRAIHLKVKGTMPTTTAVGSEIDINTMLRKPRPPPHHQWQSGRPRCRSDTLDVSVGKRVVVE